MNYFNSKLVATLGVILIVFALWGLYTQRAHGTDLPEDQNEPAALCGPLNGETVDSIDGPVTQLCNPGTPSVQTTDLGWVWGCYDSRGYQDDKCTATKITVPEKPVEEVEKLPEVQEPPKDISENPVRETPTPVITTEVPTVPSAITQTTSTPPKNRKRNKTKRNKKESFEHHCGVDRSEAPWDITRRSKNEIKTYCAWLRNKC